MDVNLLKWLVYICTWLRKWKIIFFWSWDRELKSARSFHILNKSFVRLFFFSLSLSLFAYLCPYFLSLSPCLLSVSVYSLVICLSLHFPVLSICFSRNLCRSVHFCFISLSFLIKFKACSDQTKANAKGWNNQKTIERDQRKKLKHQRKFSLWHSLGVNGTLFWFKLYKRQHKQVEIVSLLQLRF